jgi:DNA repair protein RadA/Sms
VYVSGEESLSQIKSRAVRLGTLSDNLLLMNESNLETVMETLRGSQPAEGYSAVFVDSIQTVFSEHATGGPGSVGQVCFPLVAVVPNSDPLWCFLFFADS